MEGFVELERMYLMALAMQAEAVGYSPVYQKLGELKGRIWLTAQGSKSTKPLACLAFEFGKDEVAFGLSVLGQPTVTQVVVTYADGLDEFGVAFAKTLQANRLEAPGKLRRAK